MTQCVSGLLFHSHTLNHESAIRQEQDCGFGVACPAIAYASLSHSCANCDAPFATVRNAVGIWRSVVADA